MNTPESNVFIWHEAGDSELRVLRTIPGPETRYLLIERNGSWWAALIAGYDHWKHAFTLTGDDLGETFDLALLRCHHHWEKFCSSTD